MRRKDKRTKKEKKIYVFMCERERQGERETEKESMRIIG